MARGSQVSSALYGMNTDADTTILHFGLMEWLAEKLAGDHLAIYEHTYKHLAFGSWEIVIGTCHKRRRFTWDGKDSQLSVSASELTNLASTPSWKKIHGAQFNGDSQDNVFKKLFVMAREINAV